MKSQQMCTLYDQILRYESNQLRKSELVPLFQGLVDTGLAWQLQGSYGRTAHDLIEAGVVTLPVIQ